MLKNKLPYKFFLMFLIFSVVLIVPLFLIMSYNNETMFGEIEDIELLAPEQRAIYLRYSEQTNDDLVAFTFYVFVLAFVISLFFSRRFMVPVKELYRGAKSLREGDMDIWLDVTTTDELGEVTKAFNEITEGLRKKTRELARKDNYIKAMLDPMWVVDEDNLIIDVNPAFTSLFGYEMEEVIGTSVFDFLDEESERIMMRQLYERDSGVSSSYEVSIISKSEGLMPVLISGAPIIENNVVVGKIGVIKDFRQETALRDALKHEMQYSETIMDSMVDRLLVIDKDYRICKANLAARIGAGREVGGEKCHEVFHNRKDKCFLQGEECPVSRVFENGRNFSTVHEHTDESGRKAYYEVVAFPVRGANGGIMQVVETMRDVTERKKFEDEIEMRNRELTTINSISKILSQSLKSEDIFNRVLDRVIGLMGMDGGGIFFLDEHGRELQCKFHRGLSEDFMKSIIRLKMGDDIPGSVALSGQAVVSKDISKDRRGENSMLRHSGLKGFACIPIRGKERLLGVFFIFSINAHNFVAEEESTLNSISEMMGLAFENIRLYERMKDLYEQQRIRRAEEQRNLLDLSSMLSSELDMKSVLSSCLAVIKDVCRADYVWVLDIDETGNLLLRSGQAGGLSEGGTVYTRGTSSIELYAIEKGEPFKMKEIVYETRFFIPDYLKGYASVCSIPLLIGKRTLGAFSVYYNILKDVSEEEVHFLQTVASVLAVALERARLYDNVIIQRGMADTVLESIADGVMTVDTDGGVIAMNEAAERIVGAHAEIVAGMKVGDVFGNVKENIELHHRLEKCLSGAMGGKIVTEEANFVSADERRLPLMMRSAPVRDKLGQIAGVVFVLRDLSREKEIDVMKTDFLRSVSHEFRTPLTAIVGMTEMLTEGEIEGKRMREYLKSVHSEGTRLSKMVSDVLDVARIESGKEVFRESEIDFKRILRDVKESFQSVIGKKEIDYSSVCKGDIKGYRGDKEKLKQLLRNLVDNAVTYSDVGASVELNISKADGKVRITVKDSGWGIPENDLKHAGEKFFRGKKARRAKGTGLGLSLCKDIAKMHGGDLKVESKPGEGTTVTVDLPVRRN
jgi:PAS domain S-box-containing protein